MPGKSCCWLILGPWQTRYGEHRGLDNPGIHRIVGIDAEGGRASRIIDWDKVGYRQPVYHLSSEGAPVLAVEETLSYRDLILSAQGRRVPGVIALALLAPEQGEWVVYLPIRLGDRDGLFFRVAVLDHQSPHSESPTYSVFSSVLARLPGYSRVAGSHECWYFKHDPDVEYEHKFTLDSDVDIYALARAIENHVGLGGLARYRPEYRNDFEVWQFDNFLFDVIGPRRSDRGYVSFIPRLSGGFTVKRKRFQRDGFRRFESQTLWPVVEADRADMSIYISAHLGLHARYLGSFERVRFDHMLESVDTGHIYSVMTDRCIFRDAGAVLQQIEIEYVHSRGSSRGCRPEIIEELAQLKMWVHGFLVEQEVSFDSEYTSKYTFLRRLVEKQ